MEHDELRTMVAVGAVTGSTARIWVRSDRAGAHRLRITSATAPALELEVHVEDGPADRTAAWTVPGLVADTEYRYEVVHGEGAPIGAGRFRTAPHRGRCSFRFGVISCHQPFDDEGRVRDSARAQLRAAHGALMAADARFVLMVGDQMYADHPPPLSIMGDRGLPALAREQIRARYQACYRRAWAQPELASLYADFPSWPMLDDHEVVNNFGSLEEHATPAWEALRAGALDAYFDYQASRVLAAAGERPDTFDHGFRWCSTAVYQLDIRSARRAEADHTQVVTPAQLESMRGFLRQHQDASVLVLVLTVPIAYVPTWFSVVAAALTDDSDGADRWSHPGCLPDRDRVLSALLEQAALAPHQRVLLVSGDIHVGSAFALAWEHGPVFPQLTASAITNDVGAINGLAYELVTGIERSMTCGPYQARVERIPGTPDGNPFSRLNLGIVHVDDEHGDARIRLEIVSATPDGMPQTVFLSDWL